MIKNRKKERLLVGLIILVAAFVNFGPFRVMRITSASMEPALKAGSFCLVDKRCDMGGIMEGDVVVFLLSGGGKAAHRVVRIHAEGFVTKGDANEKEDLFLVTKENFFGKIILWKNGY